MADLGANDYTQVTAARGATKSYIIANGVTLYIGELVQLESGYANKWDDSADYFLGVVVGFVTPGATGALAVLGNQTTYPLVVVDVSGLILEHLDSVGGTVSQAVVGTLVYGTSSNTDDLTMESSGRTDPIGVLDDYVSGTDVNVRLFSNMEFMAQQTA